MNFGEKLRKLRTEKAMTQEEVSKSINVSRRTYISYEQDGHCPRKIEVYRKLANIFECDLNYLITENDEISQVNIEYSKRKKPNAVELVAVLSEMFTDGELSESDMDSVMITLQQAYFDRKKNTKK